MIATRVIISQLRLLLFWKEFECRQNPDHNVLIQKEGAESQGLEAARFLWVSLALVAVHPGVFVLIIEEFMSLRPRRSAVLLLHGPLLLFTFTLELNRFPVSLHLIMFTMQKLAGSEISWPCLILPLNPTLPGNRRAVWLPQNCLVWSYPIPAPRPHPPVRFKLLLCLPSLTCSKEPGYLD